MRIKISITIFLIVISLFSAAQKEMKYDGYYVSMPDSNSISMFKYYLRFYPDGTVIGVNTAGKPDNLIPWFKKENKHVLNVKNIINKYEAKEEYGFMKMEKIK